MYPPLIDNVLHNGTFHCIVQLANPASGRRNATHSSENWQRKSGLQKKAIEALPLIYESLSRDRPPLSNAIFHSTLKL